MRVQVHGRMAVAPHQLDRYFARSLSTEARESFASKLIYTGPMAKSLVYLKRVSLTTLGLSVFGTPLMTLSNFPNPTIILTMMGVALFTSGISTGLIYYCCKPYVSRIFVHTPFAPGDASTSNSSNVNPLISLETLTLFGSKALTTLKARDLVPSSRPFSSFKVNSELSPAPSVVYKALNQELGAALRDAKLIQGTKASDNSRTEFYIHPELEDDANAHELEAVLNAIRGAERGEEAASWDDVLARLKNQSKNGNME
ncbi:uncharacterized protein BJ171DRAFT_174342 [Polychytrium aggregatum]|uniref:uncharacterized protein n=1 Tax=Polychytrium aggregatum TaxID=110093 RepID=UPI0022FE4A18|nr:uncharacterized protein BJ171DRAFT_174342 [Polychytrium aggregatum]KAI9209039.1 hypothetical protein BJ171DRAFT_174342 [Polychytrium aggregatum]